jgi:predicted TIM-barrel fold metal-dependent hydrolase
MSQRLAVVTGGSRGLGKSTVLALAERGVNSIFTSVSKSAEADAVGADKILFAVDYPYEDSNTAARFLKEAEITEEERDLISHRNAERLFLLPASSPLKETQI